MDPKDLVNITKNMEVIESCESTTAGYLWYCWSHDTHGNADTLEEASYVSEAHFMFMSALEEWDDCCDLHILHVED